jgi:PTS system fructose-specific IIA component
MDNLITKELIILDLDVLSKEEAIKEMAKLIESQGRLNNYEDYIKQVFRREEDFATSIGFEVAIPHGKTNSVKNASLAFARLKNEIQWSDEEKVKYVFLIAVPETEAGDTHLQILAKLSRKIMREEFREKLKSSLEIHELLEVLTE